MWRWLIWLMPPWSRAARRRAVLAEVKRWQAEERERAFGRVERFAQEWNGPARVNPTVRPRR